MNVTECAAAVEALSTALDTAVGELSVTQAAEAKTASRYTLDAYARLGAILRKTNWLAESAIIQESVAPLPSTPPPGNGAKRRTVTPDVRPQ